MPEQTGPPASACPVDHKTREAWLQQAQQAGAQAQAQTQAPHPLPSQKPASSILQSEGCDSSQLLNQSAATPTASGILSSLRLGTDRAISSIPRAVSAQEEDAQRPANNEADTGVDKKTGNWVYPSEQMFFNAMKRKAYNPNATDMTTIVPIHNAVNERAWKEIKEWEKGRGAEGCGGPRLESFSGLSSALTPRARWNTLLGYQPPFDRHDWVVDRCGTKVEYVIDFYAGRDERKAGKELNFYLDVRPKLNTWEGCKMRALRMFGL